MKLFKFAPIVAVLLCVSASMADVTKQEINPEKLLGTWRCDVTVEEGDIKINIISDDIYIRNGKSNSFGTMTFQSKDTPAITYSVVANGTWEINRNFLISTYTNLKFVNLTHPELDKIINLQDFFPENVSDSAEIIELSDNILSVKSESNGQRIHCTKKPKV